MLTSASQLHAEFEPIRSIMPSSVIHWALYPLTLHQLALKERLLKSEHLSIYAFFYSGSGKSAEILSVNSRCCP